MGDRTSCSLTIWGEVPSDLWSEIELEIDWNDTWKIGHYTFDEVNYGTMDPDLDKALRKAGLSYIWDHDAGYEYGPGTEMYDAETEEFIELPRHEDDLFVAVRDLTKPEVVETVIRWQRFRDQSHKKELVIKLMHLQSEIEERDE